MAWRTGLYWLKLSDPTPEEQDQHDSAALWSQCYRCGRRIGIALPADLGEVSMLLRAIVEAHRECAQSLRGARWELLVTLRLAMWRRLGAVL